KVGGCARLNRGPGDLRACVSRHTRARQGPFLKTCAESRRYCSSVVAVATTRRGIAPAGVRAFRCGSSHRRQSDRRRLNVDLRFWCGQRFGCWTRRFLFDRVEHDEQVASKLAAAVAVVKETVADLGVMFLAVIIGVPDQTVEHAK